MKLTSRIAAVVATASVLALAGCSSSNDSSTGADAGPGPLTAAVDDYVAQLTSATTIEGVTGAYFALDHHPVD